jgi:Papain-like cysteine protease AvrRpt2
MALPGFLGPSTPIAPPPRPRAAAPGLAPSSGKLAFTIQPQQQTNWCWAAVSTSVSHFFSAASTWTQCQVANATLPRNDCCGDGAADTTKCNIYGFLDQALATTGNFRQMLSRRLSFVEVQSEIQASRPVGSRVAWFGNGAHFMAIVGWLVAEGGEQYLDIADPIFLDSQITYNAYASAYHGGGDWTHSCLTQARQAQAAAGGRNRVALTANAPAVDPSSIGA